MSIQLLKDLKSNCRASSKNFLFFEIYQLLKHLSKLRKQQLTILLGLMSLSAFSEIASLGAVLPFLSALNNAGQILSKERFQPVLSALRISTESQLVISLALLFVAITVLSSLLRMTTIYLNTHLIARVGNDLSCNIYRKMLLQDYEFYTQNDSSDLINLVILDIRTLISGVLTPFLLILTNTLTSISLFAGLLFISPIISISMTVILGFSYFLIFSLRKKVLLINSRKITTYNKLQIKAIQESLGGIREVILGGKEKFFIDAYTSYNKQARLAAVNSSVIIFVPRYGIEIVSIISITLLAVSLGNGGDFSRSVPVLGSIALGANRLLPTLQQTFAAIAKMQSSRISLQRTLNRLSSPISKTRSLKNSKDFQFKSSLKLENVWFRYSPNNKWVLKNLSLSIEPYKTVAFVGSTGSGKSTTADLILGLLSPSKGRILLDGKVLKGEYLKAWQSGIAHVPQSIFLADATMAMNIAFGIPEEEIDYARITKVARLARIHDFIQDLPERYETLVGERGVRLSGGQRQRLGIARALYSHTSVIIFDEATSALDNSTEKEVMNAIESLSNEFTVILIAHRLSTIRKCDQIFEFKNGQIASSGSYDELLINSNSFREMVQADQPSS